MLHVLLDRFGNLVPSVLGLFGQWMSAERLYMKEFPWLVSSIAESRSLTLSVLKKQQINITSFFYGSRTEISLSNTFKNPQLLDNHLFPTLWPTLYFRYIHTIIGTQRFPGKWAIKCIIRPHCIRITSKWSIAIKTPVYQYTPVLPLTKKPKDSGNDISSWVWQA